MEEAALEIVGPSIELFLLWDEPEGVVQIVYSTYKRHPED